MNKAVFIDRDGVINPLVYNIKTNEYESPHKVQDFSIYPYVIKSLTLLKQKGFINIIISNQPSYAKGKTTLENMAAIENSLCVYSQENGNLIDEYYYCYHHPNGIVPEYSIKCRCRKPGTLFLEKAIEKYNLDIHSCYFVGDCDTDIQCGNIMGMYTIKINNEHSKNKSGGQIPKAFADNLFEAAIKICDII
ncbi:MAG: HAD family hydrolase [Termitinemataceae bacterium]|nr:MAG: HAD family hydrolase [Termitinemataceae bacterium]